MKVTYYIYEEELQASRTQRLLLFSFGTNVVSVFEVCVISRLLVC